MTSIRKVDNNTFLVNIDNYQTRVFVEVDHIETSQQSKVVEALVNNLSLDILSNHLKNFTYLKVEGKEFIVRERSKGNYLSLFSNFIQKGDFKNTHKIQVIPLDEVDYARQWHIEQNTAPLFAIDKESDFLDPENRFKNLGREGLFSDPFSQLAAHAFQNYHEDFSQKSASYKTSSLILTLERRNNCISYLLCEADSFMPEKYLAHKEVVSCYLEQLRYLWGTEKIALLQHRYGVDFEQLIANDMPLSVDIVYQFNIGCDLLEIQDLEGMRHSLNQIQELLSKSPAYTLLTDAFSTVKESAAVNYRFLSYLSDQTSKTASSLIAEDALHWFKAHPFLTNKISSELTARDFTILMQICRSNPAERIAKYTGRQMAGFVDSAYTHASKDTFKPWLDDHELSECCDKLVGNYSWAYFTQQLSFVVCKKHLLHRHPTKEYYVGALIPAPCKADGIQEWYKVTTCINNGAGNLSYTLEPVTADSDLPVVKLFRSTASDAYAMDSKASVKSDVNPLNSPGYEGAKLVEPYEKQFFLDRTIPLWVGHQYLAGTNLEEMLESGNWSMESLEAIATHLEQASIEWADCELQAVQPLSTTDLLREYDWLILDCLQDSFKSLPYVVTFNFYLALKKYTLGVNENQISQEDSRSDEDFIIGILNALPAPERLVLADRLEKNRLPKDNRKVEKSVYKQYTKLLGYYDEYQRLKHKGGPEDALHGVLNKWSIELDNMAKLKNEDIGSKKKQGVLCAGHSLGGALAQRTFAKYTLLSHRIPLPTQKMELYDFDAPGINRHDNAKFIEIGNRNASLLSQWPALNIHRRQSVGDFVPLGGNTHLGATFDHEDTQKVLQWLRFEAYLLEPTQEATHAGITDTVFSHGTQFLAPEYNSSLASKILEYYKIPFDSGVQGAFSEGSSELLHSLWQLDKAISIFIAMEKSCSWVRTALRTDALIALNLDLAASEDPLHGPWFEKTTPQGVLIANEHGLVNGWAGGVI